mmetsp:Transcript_22526/g.53173  ORF Transcript_22526/g.53173 Transcript_22526/m.53173 type:complete len:91 (-) Transcript_22526:3964-4236(-)
MAHKVSDLAANEAANPATNKTANKTTNETANETANETTNQATIEGTNFPADRKRSHLYPRKFDPAAKWAFAIRGFEVACDCSNRKASGVG